MSGPELVVPRFGRKTRYLLPAAIAVIGIVSSVTAFVALRNWDQFHLRRDFLEAAENRSAAFQREMEFNLHVLVSLQAFYGHAKVVTRQEFHDFVKSFSTYHHGIRALGWVPQVPEAERASYEEAAREDGLPGFRFTEWQPDGTLGTAARRVRYFPLHVIEPHEGNAVALGFDLASNPTLAQVLEASRDRAEVISVSKVKLPQEWSGQESFLMLAPVYSNAPERGSIEERRASLIGFALGAFRVDDILEKSLSHFSPEGIDVAIYDSLAGEEPSLRYLHPSRLRGGRVAVSAADEAGRGERLELVRTFDYAQRKWQVRCTSYPGYIVAGRTWDPWLALLTGLLVTALLASRSLASINRNAQVAKLVLERTDQLNQANAMLAQEIVVRTTTEAKLQKAYEEMEHRVRERTRELSLANDQLEYEISERKLSEQALKESEEKMRLIIESSPIGIRICKHDRYVYANSAFVRLFGYETADEIIGLSYNALYAPEDRERITNRLTDEPLPTAYEAKGLTKDGRQLDIAVWVNAIEYQGEPGSLAFVVDVSAEKSLKAQLYQAQKLEAIGTLAGGVAHDFNNILGVILGYSELALFDLPEGSQTRESLQHVAQAGHRAKDLVRQILTFSRRGEEERKPLFVSSILKEAMKMLRASLPSTIEIRQNLNVPPGKDKIWADPTQIHQVLMNLCTNAAHAMRDNGGVLEVSLSAACFDRPPARGPLELSGKPCLLLTVSDSGVGMNQAVIERIFDPYFTTKAPGEGTGLGLAVVHGIVQSHKGVIAVQSEPGKGTTFNVFLPCLEAEVDMTWEPTTAELSCGHETILLVDDETDLVRVGGRMLERLGYHVTVMTSSIEALETFRTQPSRFDLVITDQTMPKMTGLDLAKELMRTRPEIPVILCTGLDGASTREKARAAGIREFLAKPLTIEEVAKAIRKELVACTPAAVSE